MISRPDVYEAIDSERDYQILLESDSSRCQEDPQHSVGDYLTMLSVYVRWAQEAWTGNAGDSEALHGIRKVAGIAVNCMEHHGAPHRPA